MKPKDKSSKANRVMEFLLLPETYTRCHVDNKYIDETAVERYNRLMQEFDTKLQRCLEQLAKETEPTKDVTPATDEILETYRTTAITLKSDLKNAWENLDHTGLRLKEALVFEAYVLETLSRSCKLFDNPHDFDNQQQLRILSKALPGEWVQRASGLAMDVLVLAAVAALVTGVIFMGQTSSLSLLAGIDGAFVLGLSAKVCAQVELHSRYTTSMKKDLGQISQSSQAFFAKQPTDLTSHTKQKAPNEGNSDEQGIELKN